MPCEHCPHCQQIEEEKRLAVERLLAEQQQITVKQEILDSNDAPEIPQTVDLSDVYEHLKPVALQIFHTWVEKKIHVIDGIAGGGKTFLLNVLWRLFKDSNQNVEILSYSEIGSPTGKTIRKFVEQLKYNSSRKPQIILIDNAHQIAEHEFLELSDRLQGVTYKKEALFGDVCVIMAVDFGMPTPYCKEKKSRSVKYWLAELGDKVTRHNLPHSGNGRDVFVEELRTAPKILLEDRFVINSTDPNARSDPLIHFVYGDLNDKQPYAEMASKDGIILAPRKNYVDELNRACRNKLEGPDIELEAQFDGTIIRGDLDIHTIVLRKHCIIALEMPHAGLPVGTRLMLMDDSKKTLFCKVIDGEKAGSDVEIVRVKRNLSAAPSESQQWVKQFPVELAFAMSIHRAQGRRFTKVGIANLVECFAHGMVYSAMSRTNSLFGTKVLIEQEMDKVIHTKHNKEMMEY